MGLHIYLIFHKLHNRPTMKFLKYPIAEVFFYLSSLLVRAWDFTIATTCRTGSIPAWCRFSEKYYVSSLSTCQRWKIVARCCALRQGTSHSKALLHSCVNLYLMAMCTISSKRRSSCRAVCSPWSWHTNQQVWIPSICRFCYPYMFFGTNISYKNNLLNP